MGRKSRRKRERRRRRSVSLDAETTAALQRQLKAFEEKFGRPPGPNDPVFFDPDADEPVPIPPAKYEAAMTDAMERAGIDRELIFASQLTGMIPVAGREHLYSEADLQEWDEAIRTYRALHRPESTDADELRAMLETLLVVATQGVLDDEPEKARLFFDLLPPPQDDKDEEVERFVFLSELAIGQFMLWLTTAKERFPAEELSRSAAQGLAFADGWSPPVRAAAGDLQGLLGVGDSKLTMNEILDRHDTPAMLLGLWALVCGMVRVLGGDDASWLHDL